MRNLVLSEHNCDDWAVRHSTGRAASRLPYGIDELEDLGHELVMPRQSTSARARALWAKVEHPAGGPVERPFRGFLPAARTDVVIALLEQQAIVPAFLRRRRLGPMGRQPLVLMSCWLAQWLSVASPEERGSLQRRYAGIDKIVTWSRNQHEVLEDAGFAPERLAAVPFGIDSEFYDGDPRGERNIDVLAVGQDSGRDYGTLFDAVRGTGLRVDLVCKPANLVGLDIPEEVRLHGTVEHEQYRAMLRNAKVVAVPTHAFQYPTGQSVAMEAAAAGAAVAVTGTAPMREYFDDSRAALVAVGDADGWWSALTDLLASESDRIALATVGQRAVRELFHPRVSWAAFDEILRSGTLRA